MFRDGSEPLGLANLCEMNDKGEGRHDPLYRRVGGGVARLFPRPLSP